MPKSQTPKIPKLRKVNGYAAVGIDGKVAYLGKWDCREYLKFQADYARFLIERQSPDFVLAGRGNAKPDATVADLPVAFLDYAEKFIILYRFWYKGCVNFL